jgi:type I site-specific restriction-modification system R (restriction) subunit
MFQDIEYIDPRENIIILIDEAHRSQPINGDLFKDSR